MNILERTIEWGPRYTKFAIDSEQLILLSEIDSYLLSGPHIATLDANLTGAASVRALVDHHADLSQRASLLRNIELLLGANVLVASRARQLTETVGQNYRVPVPSITPRSEVLRNGHLEIKLYSDFDVAHDVVKSLSNIASTHRLTIAVVDDYLDPRLAELNAQHLANGYPWVLLKVTGDRPLLGPYLEPTSPQAPCWQCLATALIRNQPLRRWLQRREPNEFVAPPIKHDRDTITAMTRSALALFNDLPLRELIGNLRQLGAENSQAAPHRFARMPHCSACGSASHDADLKNSEIVLHSSVAHHASDGGYRTRTPAQTLETANHMLGDICGVAHGLERLPNSQASSLQTYRCAFFKTTHAKTHLHYDQFVQISLGKGVEPEQSRASAVGEALERYAVQWQEHQIALPRPAAELSGRVIEPHELSAYGEQQLQRAPADECLHWTKAWSLLREAPCFVPLTYCFANTPFDTQTTSTFNTNGCAAGNTCEEALLQGLLELVERDAAAVWWYNKIVPPTFHSASVSEECERATNATLADGWTYWILDITHDFEIPVAVAVAQHRETGKLRLGFGCHFEARLACQRALTELCQLIGIESHAKMNFDFDAIDVEPYLLGNGTTTAAPKDRSRELCGHAGIPDIRDDVIRCVRRASALGLDDVVALRYARPEILPFQVVKVMVPGLCHIWPQFGHERLYNVPVAMGWRSPEEVLTETELNATALLI